MSRWDRNDYYGPFPKGFERWRTQYNRQTHTLMDSTGLAALDYDDHFYIRGLDGEWTALGKSVVFRRFYWVELADDNPHNHSKRFLDKVFSRYMPQAVQDYIIMPLEEKTREITTLARRQQSQWAKAVRERGGNVCYVTGSSMALEAAHLKPFAICSVAEAVALDNGVCLTASVHRLFDSISSIDELPTSDPLLKCIDRKKLAELIDRRNQKTAIPPASS